MEGRTKKSARNMVVAMAMHLIAMILSFASRTVFAKLLATEYLGLSGLFTNIISVLSLSELGIGNVIIIHLYKPLAENDEEKVCRLMNFYRKAYTLIGVVVIACGVALMPFLDKLVKYDGSIPYLEFYYLLFVLQAASSYFFAYKRSLLTASQREYICSLVQQVFDAVMKVLQILFLWITRQYVAFLLVSIVTSIGSNLVISHITDKKFPYLKKNQSRQLDKTEAKGMFKNVSSMMLHKIGNTVINSTDNILISSMIGIIYTGLYSNYVLIMNMVTMLISICFNAVSASVGDYNARKTPQERKSLFDVMCFMGMWAYGMGAICFACLYQPTIQIWLGTEYLLDFKVVLVISVNFFINGLLRVPGTFSDVNELYVKTKFKPIAMAAINLVTSIIFLKLWDLVGVLVGTFVSYLFIGLWVDPWFLYRDVFQMPVYKYFLSLLRYTVTIVAIGVVTYVAVDAIAFYVGKVLVAFLVSNGLLLLCFCKNPAIRFVWERVKTITYIRRN